MEKYTLEMIGITKKFGQLVANNDITLKLQKGEIHAILGENGAGKSTLMSILFGLYQADAGEIKINGEVVHIKNPNDANNYHIGMVHQHFKLVDTFTVLENIILGKETVSKSNFLDYDTPRKQIEALSKKYNLNVPLDAYIKDLNVGIQQKVEILKMLYRDSDILIFDEPTSVLTPQEIDGLFQIIRNFAKEGKTIVIITHKLNEIKAIAERCSVLRRGKLIGTVLIKDTKIEQLSSMMVGRNVNFHVNKEKQNVGETVLEVKNLTYFNKDKTKKILDDVAFEVKAGEIVAIAGVEGNGQSELVSLITGLSLVEDKQSKIILNGQDITKESIRKRIKLGMSHIPEDRQKHGLILDYKLGENLISNTYMEEMFQKHGYLLDDKIVKHGEELVNSYDIRSAAGIKSKARDMSGGNQQKAIIARETTKKHNLLIASQPTRGLDVGAIEYVHQVLVKERNNGQAVLVVSYELDEVIDISDRILVIREGKIVYNVKQEDTTIEELGLYMLFDQEQGTKI